jgi:DNA-binding HxlR family transcriptional regulator
MNYKRIVRENEQCTVERTLEVIGNKWTTLILRDLLHGTKRFGELRNNLSGISPKTLTDRLRYLEEQGVLTRKIHPEIPPKVEYSLTKKGKDLGKIIFEMSKWGEFYTS